MISRANERVAKPTAAVRTATAASPVVNTGPRQRLSARLPFTAAMAVQLSRRFLTGDAGGPPVNTAFTVPPSLKFGSCNAPTFDL